MPPRERPGLVIELHPDPESLATGSWFDAVGDDLLHRLPKRSRGLLRALNAGISQTELAGRLGVSRFALRRELARIQRDYLSERPPCAQCGEQLPTGSTRRRKFCKDYCRVTFARRTLGEL
jgi:hypothetical protein